MNMEKLLNSLNMQEVAFAEEVSGQGIGTLGDPTAPRGKMMMAMACVIKRREQAKQGLPVAFSMEQAGLLSLNEIADLVDSVDPTPEPTGSN